MTRRNHQQRGYLRVGHRLSRLARPAQVATWIRRHVRAEGGSATFHGFGPTALRLFGKAEALLGPGYRSRLILHDLVPGKPGKVGWRQRRQEYRLMVRRDSPEPLGESTEIGRSFPSDPETPPEP